MTLAAPSDAISLTAFAAMVKSMRDEQKKYFKTRDGQTLFNSKRLEQSVDKALQDITAGQGSMRI